MEKTMKELQLREAIEAPAKEAMYALDDANPLRLYDCLVPEIEAYRPLARTTSDEVALENNIAKLALKEAELKIVSDLGLSLASDSQ